MSAFGGRFASSTHAPSPPLLTHGLRHPLLSSCAPVDLVSADLVFVRQGSSCPLTVGAERARLSVSGDCEAIAETDAQLVLQYFVMREGGSALLAELERRADLTLALDGVVTVTLDGPAKITANPSDVPNDLFDCDADGISNLDELCANTLGSQTCP